MVNGYISVAAATGTSTAIRTSRPVGEKTQGNQESAAVIGRHQTPSIIDPEQFPRSPESSASATTAASTAAHGSTGFSAPPPFTGLPLHELTSLHEKLNEIAYTPQWRDNAPDAIAGLRRLLPMQPPPAYELLAWACDQFAAFTRSGSCGDSTALMDVLNALQALIKDARRQQQPSTFYPAGTTPPPSKRLRLDSCAVVSQSDSAPKSTPGGTLSSVQDCLIKLERIPADAQDWTDQAAPITKELLEALENDRALCSRHPHLLTLCMVFDTCNSKVVGEDLVSMLRKVVEENEAIGTATRTDSPMTSSVEADARPRSTTAMASMDLVFGSAVENAICGILRDHPTLTSRKIQKILPDLKLRALRQSVDFVRAHIAFHLPTDQFLRILDCLDQSRSALSFLNNLSKSEDMSISSDLVDELQNALTEYRAKHGGKTPRNEAEVALFVKALKPSETAAAIRRAATYGPPGCVSRARALSDWMKEEPDLVVQMMPPQVELQPAGNGANNAGPPTVKRTTLEDPSAGNMTVHHRMPDLSLLTVRKAANAARDEVAFSLPALEVVLNAIAIVDASATPDVFRAALGKKDIGMNSRAFPDWKIALRIYKQTYGNSPLVSEKDVENLAKCIQVSTTASPVFWALARGAEKYCQPIEIATEDWRRKEPHKFEPFKNSVLPNAVWL